MTTDGLSHPPPAGGADDGVIYAMKSLRKEVLLRRNQIEHTKTERAILEGVNHPFIVGLRYAFQTQEKLYLVTGASAPDYETAAADVAPLPMQRSWDAALPGVQFCWGYLRRTSAPFRRHAILTATEPPAFAAADIATGALRVRRAG